MPRRSKAESEATAARVLEVAAELFGRSGYAAVGVEAVAAAAGVTRGAVYHHYGDKAGLFRAVVTRAQAAVAAAVESAADAEADPWRGLEEGCRAFLHASAAPGVRQVLLVDAPAALGWAEWRAEDAAHSGRLLEESLSDLSAAGALGDTDPAAAAALLSGAMNEAALWIADSPVPSAEPAWRTLRTMLGALRTPGTPPGGGVSGTGG
ncbi:TetR/AcrR family transcriptional regulator [Blastococcus sp. SYSU D00695]